MVKNLVLGWIYAHRTQIRDAKILLKTLASSVTRYYGELSLRKVSEKTNDPVLRKFSDGRTDAQRDKQTDESDFIGRCPTNVERPTVTYETRKHNWNPGSILHNLINLKSAIIKNYQHAKKPSSIL